MTLPARFTRMRDLLLAPRKTWSKIADENATSQSIYTTWVLWLAAIPLVASLIGLAIYGSQLPLGFSLSLRMGSATALLSYAIDLIKVLALAMCVSALAPSFGGRKDRVQALKAVAYAYTPIWIASSLMLLPPTWPLATAVGHVADGYAIYLLYIGLPATMKCPQDCAAGYVVVTVIISLLLLMLGALLLPPLALLGRIL